MTRAWGIGTALAVAIGSSVAAADWPQWRGPQGTGVSNETGLPERWSATENVAWKAALAGLGVSTPIVSGERVFVTSQVGPGMRRPGNHPRLVQGQDAAAAGERGLGTRLDPAAGERTFFVVEAFHRDDGRQLWEHRFEAKEPLQAVHDKHNLATPSPVTDGETVFAWFGTGQLVALDATSGRPVWERHLGREIAPFDINWGHGSSPALYQDLLILQCDHPAGAYLLAVDKRSGEDSWRADRGTGRSSYSTPLVIETDGGPELIVNSSERVDAYDPRTGTLLWHTGGENQYPVPSPVFHDDLVYMSRGYRSGPYKAIRPGGRGDVSSTHVAWRVPTGAPYVSSLVHEGGTIYMANDVGVITAVDARTGRRIWQERLGGIFSASPVAADGRIYFVSETGETFVIRSGLEPELIARNDLGARTLASPAVSEGRIFIRTDEHLFSIGAPGGERTAGRSGTGGQPADGDAS